MIFHFSRLKSKSLKSMEGNLQGKGKIPPCKITTCLSLSLHLWAFSQPRRHITQWCGVKGTEVDQSCFNDPVKWIKARVSELPSK